MIFLDIETQNDWKASDVIKIEDYKISYTGVIEYSTKRELDFWEQDMESLGQLLRSTDLIVHYNGFTFDMPIIANYLGAEVLELPQLDLMVAVQKKIGFRPKLDDVANATLGYGKIGKGYDAVKYWASGDLDSLKKYCLQDVRVTMDVYDFGIKNGYIRYFDKNGFLKKVEIDWSLGKRVQEEKLEDQIITMF